MNTIMTISSAIAIQTVKDFNDAVVTCDGEVVGCIEELKISISTKKTKKSVTFITKPNGDFAIGQEKWLKFVDAGFDVTFKDPATGRCTHVHGRS